MQLRPGQIFTTTISFHIPPLERAQGHHFSLWIETLYRDALPGLPDVPAEIPLRFEAGPLPLQVSTPNAAQQLKANLQLDQTGWRLQVTDQAGQVPTGPLWGEVEATWSNGAMAGPLNNGVDGVWSGQWGDQRLSQSSAQMMMRAWVAAPGYVTAVVTQTLLTDAEQSNTEIVTWLSAGEPPTRHTFTSLEEAQATLTTTIYRPARLPDGAVFEDIAAWDTVLYDSQHRVNLAQTYRLPNEGFLTLNQSSAEGYDPASWGTARYAPDAQLVRIDGTTGHLIQHFGFWLLDWTMNDQVFELRAPASTLSIEQLLDIATGIQPLR